MSQMVTVKLTGTPKETIRRFAFYHTTGKCYSKDSTNNVKREET